MLVEPYLLSPKVMSIFIKLMLFRNIFCTKLKLDGRDLGLADFSWLPNILGLIQADFSR